VCGTLFYCNTGTKTCSSEHWREHLREVRRVALRRYQKSAKGQQTRRHYELSPKYRESRRRYYQSPEYREARRRYEQSEKGQETRRRRKLKKGPPGKVAGGGEPNADKSGSSTYAASEEQLQMQLSLHGEGRALLGPRGRADLN
jgi:hypothetical protein